MKAHLIGHCVAADLDDEPVEALAHSRNPRGRPQKFAWDKFYAEVAARRDDLLGMKRDAAIQTMVGWFEKTLGEKPGFTTVKEKLVPIFRRCELNGN